MDLSVIVPVYNTEIKILEQCIKSIMKLKNINYELLLIDDGSESENSIEYENLIKNFNLKNIKYIYKENSGVSSARNLGVEKANGRFVMFVDSDDTIIADNLNNNILNINANVLIFNMVLHSRNKKAIRKEFENKKGYIDKISIFKEYIKRNAFHGPCSKLYDRDFIERNNIKFEKKIIQGEDALFNLNILNHNPVVYYTDIELYNYFYDYKNTDKRWENNPFKMTDNLKTLYTNEVEVSKKINEEQKNYVYLIKEKYLNEIFRACMIILHSKVLSDDKKLKVILKLKDFLQQLKIVEESNKKIRLKNTLIIQEKWNIIKFLASIRNIYLNIIKGKIW